MPSRKTRITKRIVDSMRPGELVWDTDIAGFAVRCQRQSKTYALKTRIAGRQRWFTIGRHGSPWTSDTARKEALTILAEIAKGKDPAAKRDAESKIPTIKKLVERYLDEEVDPKRKPSTAKLYRDYLERLVIPKIGTLKSDQTSFSDMAALHHKLRRTPYQANRVMAVVSAMFGWSEKVGIRERGTNPCVGLQKFKEKQRERFLSADELNKVGEAFESLLENKGINPYVVAAIRLLIFTGCRRDEILTLQWRHVDFDRAMLLLPDSKTGKKIIHLNAPAIEVLSNVKKIAGNPYVICGQKEGLRLVNLRKPWKRVCKLVGLDDVRIHDLRHSFASVAASGGASLQVVGKLLGHTQTATTERYSHLASDPIIAANEAIGQQIAAMMKGESAEIIPLKERG